MLADLLTKASQRALFLKFRKVIMVWKYIDIIHIVPPSAKERVLNIYEVEPIKEFIESNAETTDKNTVRKIYYVDIDIYGNIRRH